MLGLAGRLSLAALVEVHDERELKRALGAGAELIGVNQRDLRTFEVDQQRALALGDVDPGGSGGRGRVGHPGGDDVGRLAGAGYQAVLVGETLVRVGGPAGGRGRRCSEP